MSELWNSKGLKVTRTTQDGHKMLEVTLCQPAASLTKAEAFSLCHAIMDDLRKSKL